MKAFKIEWYDRDRARMVDLGYKYQLPRVECLDCEPKWKSWGEGMFEFPALQFGFFNAREFTFDRIVSLDEFCRLKERIQRAAGRCINLIPGCSIGELSGEAFGRELDDFVWGTITTPQISKRACNVLSQESIHLITAECLISCGRKRIDTHLAVQIEPVALLTEECRHSLGITQCPRCGHFKHPPPQARIRRPSAGSREGKPYLIRRSAWPKGQHLVTIQETLDVIASCEFMEAVKKHKLRNIAFIECGRYV